MGLWEIKKERRKKKKEKKESKLIKFYKEREMERKVLALCSTVGLLGLLSAATGFGAEATRIKVKFWTMGLFLV